MSLDYLIEKLRNSLNGMRWLKCEGGRFLTQGEVIGEAVEGIIEDCKLSYVRWENGAAEKITEEEAAQRQDLKNFSPQMTIKLRSGDHQFGITVSQITIERYLLPYLNQLQNDGLELEQVVTRLSACVAAGKKADFGVVKFGLIRALAPATAETVDQL